MESRVLVLGGNGFIGRHAVAALLAQGARVTVGSRRAVSAAGFSSGISVEALRLHERTTARDWLEIVDRFDVILNCVGILRQRPGETYENVHHLAPAALADACAGHRTRFVQVSALGLSVDAHSRFLSSKWRGDEAILATPGECFVARLSLLDGDGGFGASWLRGVAKLPLFVVPASARGKIAALTAEDAGEALAQLCLTVPAPSQSRSSRLFELGEQQVTRLRTTLSACAAATLQDLRLSWWCRAGLPGWPRICVIWCISARSLLVTGNFFVTTTCLKTIACPSFWGGSRSW